MWYNMDMARENELIPLLEEAPRYPAVPSLYFPIKGKDIHALNTAEKWVPTLRASLYGGPGNFRENEERCEISFAMPKWLGMSLMNRVESDGVDLRRRLGLTRLYTALTIFGSWMEYGEDDCGGAPIRASQGSLSGPLVLGECNSRPSVRLRGNTSFLRCVLLEHEAVSVAECCAEIHVTWSTGVRYLIFTALGLDTPVEEEAHRAGWETPSTEWLRQVCILTGCSHVHDWREWGEKVWFDLYQAPLERWDSLLGYQTRVPARKRAASRVKNAFERLCAEFRHNLTRVPHKKRSTNE